MRWYGLFGLLALVLAEAALFKGVGIVKRYFYLFAWWPYILFVDAVVAGRDGRSVLTGGAASAVSCAVWSVSVWLLFELFNLRLGNWHYVDLTPHPWIRWPGYALSFATVLPGIFVTRDLLRPLFKAWEGRRGWGMEPEALWILGGASMLALTLLVPEWCYPLVWGGFIFLLHPVVLRLGGRSPLSEPAELLSLLASGLLCGILWEFWNYWAESKWIYTVPHVPDVKLFEMPLAGYLGFPPFAVECALIYELLVRLGLARPLYGEAPRSPRLSSPAVSLAFSIPFWAACFVLMDRWTVLSFAQT